MLLSGVQKPPRKEYRTAQKSTGNWTRLENRKAIEIPMKDKEGPLTQEILDL